VRRVQFAGIVNPARTTGVELRGAGHELRLRRPSRRKRLQGIRVYDEAAKAACVRELAGMRMQGDEVDNRLDTRFDVTGALRGVLIDMRQDVNEFFCGAKRVS
jgi:hypothetical protein